MKYDLNHATGSEQYICIRHTCYTLQYKQLYDLTKCVQCERADMDFIFNINNGTEEATDNKNLEDVLKDIETHFEDWNNFYNLYQMFAPPPTDNVKQIQHWFKELQQSFFKIIKKYNETVHEFAEIQELQEDEVHNIMKNTMAKMNDKKSKPNDDEDVDSASSMMWT